MRPAQEVMADLAASGLTGQQIALVMELSAAVATEARPTVDRAAENKRAYDREYRKAHPREFRTKSYDHNETPSPNEIDNLTPTREEKTEAKASSKNGTGTRLPDDWKPKPLVEKTAEMVAAWPAGMIERELAKFKDHWLKTPGSRGRSLDWDASYRNWLRNADERKPKHGQSASNITSLRGSRPDPALDLYRAACAAEDREDNLRAGTSLPAIGSGGP